jgi:peptidoglycan/LPS O-acetylase OafA/YrhL
MLKQNRTCLCGHRSKQLSAVSPELPRKETPIPTEASQPDDRRIDIHHRPNRYFPEIDGLRAIAVLAVVFHHAGMGFSGGYVGVDIFFVISGFLITGIITKQIENKSFSLLDFWARRIRRILPAVSVVVACSLVAGFLILDGPGLRSLSLSAIAQTVIAANVFFSLDVGYFAKGAEFKPLLHTWSLAVEEQFYLFLPLLLLITYRFFKRKSAVWVIAAIFLASLTTCIYSAHDPAAFYHMHRRAWELLAGALLACLSSRIRMNRSTANVSAALGLALMLGSIFLYDTETATRSAYAVPPVLGAVLFIAACTKHSTMTGTMLSLRPVVFTGLISYSLYLWHWPIFSFSRSLFIETTMERNLWMIAIALAVSVISWRFIETPMRRAPKHRPIAKAFVFGGVVSVGLLFLSAFLVKFGSHIRPESPRLATLASDIYWVGNGYRGKPSPMGLKPVTPASHRPAFVYWGDSHAMASAQLVDNKASEHGLTGAAYLRSSILPVPGIVRAHWNPSRRSEVLEFNQRVFRTIVDEQIPHVILLCRWTSCLTQDKFATDAITSTDRPRQTEAHASLLRQLQRLLDALQAEGIHVWLIHQLPEISSPYTARDFYLKERFPSWNDMPSSAPFLPAQREKHERLSNVFGSLDAPNLTVLDPTPQCLNAMGEIEIYSDRSHYRDAHHVTRHGAEHFLGNALDVIFSRIQSEQTLNRD